MENAMTGMKQYWLNRYQKQGEKTVGNSSFTDTEFEERTGAAIKLLLKTFSFNNIMASKVLDFGCGPGRMTKALIPLFADVYGIDIVPWAIEEAKKRCYRGKFHIFDGKSIPFMDAFFGAVVSWTVLQHIPPEEVSGTCSEIMRVLAPNGKIILYENVSIWKGDKEHIWFRPVNAYWKLFEKLDCIAVEVIKGADGNDEEHVLMVLKKRMEC